MSNTSHALSMLQPRPHAMPAGRRSQILKKLLVVITLLTAAVHFYQSATYALPSGQFKNLHVGLSLVIVFVSLADAAPAKLRRVAFLLLALICLVPLFYIHLEFAALVSDRMFEATPWDTLISLMLVLTTLIAVACQWGITIPITAIVALLYALFGPLFPGELLFHGGISATRLLSYASIPYFQGILGSLTSLSAGTVFILMVFAGLLKATGGIDFIMSLGRAISGRSLAGPAQVSVLCSGFMGMISGSTVANVASTGAMTIPMMKSHGFKAEHAAAIEAVASTGGQFAPPVMGLTAFLIVGMTGIPYNEIMLAAVFPAVVFYGYLIAAVNLEARVYQFDDTSDGLRKTTTEPSESPTSAIRQYGHLLLSIGVLVYLLATQMPPAFAASYAIAVIAVTEISKQIWIARRTPWSGLWLAIRTLIAGIDDGVRNGAQLAIVIALIGIFVDVLVTTGFAQKLSFLIFDFASDRLWLMLAATALACLVFGLGLPTPAAYILVALLGVPALERVGIPQISAHMFVFFFANMSAITPPVAVAALVAAKLAGASYFRTAFVACRLGMAGFVLPFIFVFAPAILLVDSGAAEQWLTFAGTLLALVALNMAFVGFVTKPLSMAARLLLLVAAMLIFQFDLLVSVAGAFLVAAIILQQFWHTRRAT